MGIKFLLPENVQYFKDCIAAIEKDATAKWGELNPTQLLAHLRFAVECSLGEHSPVDKSTFFTRTALRYFVFHLVTNWPQGKIKAPDYFTPQAEDEFDTEKKKLLEVIDRFIEEVQKDPNKQSVSEIFGPMTLAYQCRVHGVHFHHHFKQFGICS
jgi:hypothetical protein